MMLWFLKNEIIQPKQINMDVYRVVVLFLCIVTVHSLPYNVHWFSGPSKIERNIPSVKKSVDIYCYTGSILFLSETFILNIRNYDFIQYTGKSPEEVYKDLTEDSFASSVVIPFQNTPTKTISMPLLGIPTCIAVSAKEKHSIELQVQSVNLWIMVPMAVVIVLLFAATDIGDIMIFYLCAILIGVSASFLLLVYHVRKLLPRVCIKTCVVT